jgi:hypothetical protein
LRGGGVERRKEERGRKWRRWADKKRATRMGEEAVGRLKGAEVMGEVVMGRLAGSKEKSSRER